MPSIARPTARTVAQLFSSDKLPSLPDLEQADKLARDCFTLVDTDKDKLVSRQQMYSFLVLQAGESSTEHVRMLLEPFKADEAITPVAFSSAVQQYCAQLLRAASGLRASTAAAAAAEAATQQQLTKAQVLKGSDKLNRLSKTNAFNMQVIGPRAARHMYSVFQQVDRNHGGTISLSEFKQYLARHMPDIAHMAPGIFSTLDKAGSGQVSFRQLLEMFYPSASKADLDKLTRMATNATDGSIGSGKDGSIEDRLSELLSILSVYDDKKSGHLDEEELTHALQLGGYTEEEAVRIFGEIDREDRGWVTAKQFQTWFVGKQH